MCDLTYRAIVARNTSPGNRANLKRRSTFATHGSGGDSIQVVPRLALKRATHRCKSGRLDEPDCAPMATHSDVIGVGAGVGATKEGKMAPNFS
jgi:hypothetical protein